MDLTIGNRTFHTSNTYVMGILNVTPDSFSDGGSHNNLDAALFHVERMINEGMDIVDVGGESTRPGYTLISDDEEIERVVPIIEAIREKFDIPVSLDTYKYKVAEAGIKAGAHVINDIWGLKYDKGEMASLVAKENVPYILMHNRKDADYRDFVEDVISDIKESLDIAHRAGIHDENIILDPGVGFAKSYEQNLQIMKELNRLHCFGLPVLLGSSRKSVIGLTLDLPADQRVEGTLVTSVLAVNKGAMFVRVHDVKENVRAIKMARALL